MSRGDLAKVLGVDARTVGRWETPGGSRPTGAAAAVLSGLREKLTKDPGEASAVVKVLIAAAAVGGLAYLIVKLLDVLTEPEPEEDL